MTEDFIPIEEITKANPHLIKRVQKQAEQDTTYKENKEAWPVTTGDYSKKYEGYFTVYNESVEDNEYIGDKEHGIVAFEKTIQHATSEALEINSSQNKPTIILDAGGGDGLTMAKLAEIPENQQAIERGDLILVVTNMEAPIEELLERSDLNGQQLELIRNNIGKVNYIQADANMLPEIEIPTAMGNLPLRNNVSVLHERLSVSYHTYTPEVHVPKMMSLVSENGIYFLDEPKKDNSRFEKPRNLANTQNEIAERMGLVQISEVESGPKKGEQIQSTVFRKGNGPKVWAD